MAAEALSLTQKINLWAQTVAIAGAGVWGTFTFYYQVREANQAPVNITLDLQLRTIPSGNQKSGEHGKELIPIEVKVTAKNPSPRTVYLLPNAWIAWGAKIAPTTEPRPIRGIQITRETGEVNSQMHASSGGIDVVGVGRLFQDDRLKPGELVTRTLIIYVPPSKYDEIAVKTLVPTATKDKVVDFEWKLNEKAQAFDSTVYRLGPKEGERTEVPPGADRGYLDQVELRLSSSASEISLRN